MNCGDGARQKSCFVPDRCNRKWAVLRKSEIDFYSQYPFERYRKSYKTITRWRNDEGDRRRVGKTFFPRDSPLPHQRSVQWWTHVQVNKDACRPVGWSHTYRLNFTTSIGIDSFPNRTPCKKIKPASNDMENYIYFTTNPRFFLYFYFKT